jgi:ribosomal protein S12 methylthiotransferase
MQLPVISDTSSSNRASGQLDRTEAQDTARGRYAVVSLGCPKNLVDTEQMLGRLDADGYSMVDSVEGADFVVINTCGFIASAREESLGAIDEMLQLKRDGKIRGVVVTGCLAERSREALLEQRPEIDALIGVFGRDEIVSVADRLFGGLEEQRTVFRPAPIRALADNVRTAVTPRHFAYLKISEGCDRLCTFCAIPKMRGKHATKPIEQVISEAKALAKSGVREMVVVAQDTTYYGMDLYGKPRLQELLEELDQVEGLDWIRLMYFYPMYIDDSLLKTIAQAKRIVPYIDMPLQHASDTMLRRMARRVNRVQIEEIVGKIRELIPGVILRTTMITGFPGETKNDHQQLSQFIADQRFEHLGVFPYSIEPGTPAEKLPDRIPEKVIQRRLSELMAIQQEIAFDWTESRVGSAQEVLLDSRLPDQEGVWIGRTAAEAPDIDGLVYVTEQPGDELRAGAFVPCEMVAADGHDLIAVPVGTCR